MFKGVFEHQLDDKNRLRIPSRFKKELTGENGEKTYSFFRGMNRCICVMADDLLDDTISEISEEAISERLALKSVVNSLEERDRRLIELRYFKGLTQVKTAEELGMSQVQVSRREKAILIYMRKAMS